jgi:hypothetical protein
LSDRKVYCEDALHWLESFLPETLTSCVSSLPDFSEFPQLSLLQWQDWFIKTSALIMNKTSPEGVAIFFQSDIKFEGEWVDKAFLVQKAAEQEGYKLLWHKIFCRVPPGVITFGRPAYSHLLCFSKSLTANPSTSTPDVFNQSGEKAWERGMFFEACFQSLKFISSGTKTQLVLNPFCGLGSVLAMADFFKLNSIGIEISPKRAEKARGLKVNLSGKSWELNYPNR